MADRQSYGRSKAEVERTDEVVGRVAEDARLDWISPSCGDVRVVVEALRHYLKVG